MGERWAGGSVIFSTKNPKLFLKKFWWWWWGGGGLNFLIRNPNLKQNIFFAFFFFKGGGGRCRQVDGQTNRHKPICPFNFFKVGGIMMH